MENETNETVRNNFAMVDSKTKESLVRKMIENAPVHHSTKHAEHNFRKKKSFTFYLQQHCLMEVFSSYRYYERRACTTTAKNFLFPFK